MDTSTLILASLTSTNAIFLDVSKDITLVFVILMGLFFFVLVDFIRRVLQPNSR